MIVGGESGRKARPLYPSWVRLLRDQCEESNTAFFFKQWGEWMPYEETVPPYWEDMNGNEYDGNAIAFFDDHTGEFLPCWHPDTECSPFAFKRGGKRENGNMLDGKQHLAFPR